MDPADASHIKTTMHDAAIAQFSEIEWAAALINDPQWTPTQTASRRVKSTREDSFIAETLDTERTIRSCLTLKPTKEDEGDLAYKEIVTLMDLGDGLNGHPKILHGGFAATMLDEVCGILIGLTQEIKVRRLRERGMLNANTSLTCFTAYLNTSYKKPIPAPGPVLCRARFERIDGRKQYIRATIEDGAGTVYTVGDAMFVEVKAKL
ncbi:hypothetical protein P153DRAFT_363406 [Dothidotthia symphoricarpi CBS 119687]|uniref:Thioesterase domain-containing protein n=1 Tax=Dothidotthia symphoricarpi CBS 119687 TaxID=1392245 RepID=A0A6A6ANT8_9PLEO|nr:uncharacterized protein P153DRAFT_363406 [Dothidotthia symphoricarpi CBS 119687]KAF2133196.1 hypothetical protein P153DRAFT_363406 [Dothidotthia symphoricarpi CBS 119687]